MPVDHPRSIAEDFDNDGYLSLSDLRSACDKFKIPNSSAMADYSASSVSDSK